MWLSALGAFHGAECRSRPCPALEKQVQSLPRTGARVSGSRQLLGRQKGLGDGVSFGQLPPGEAVPPLL